jgi:hypothetical protein
VRHWQEILHKAGFELINPRAMINYLSDKPTRRTNDTYIDSQFFENENHKIV